MYLPLLTAAAAGLTVFAVAEATGSTYVPDTAETSPLLGETLFSSDAPIERWGDPVAPEDLLLEGQGRVAGVVLAPDGSPEVIVVAVGGLWGLGAHEVEVGMERVHLLEDADGQTRIVVDLSV